MLEAAESKKPRRLPLGARLGYAGEAVAADLTESCRTCGAARYDHRPCHERDGGGDEQETE